MAREEMLYQLYEEQINNYIEAVKDAKYKAVTESNRVLIKALNKESCDCIDLESSVVLEEVNKDIISDARESFEEIFEVFLERTRELYEAGYAEYIESNKYALENAKFDNLEISVYPYWKTDKNSFKELYKSLILSASKILQQSDDSMGLDLSEKFGIDHLQCYGTELTTGVYNYLRNQNPRDLNVIYVKGEDIKNLIQYMTEYINGYNMIIPEVIDIKKDIESALDQLYERVHGFTENSTTRESHSVLLEAVDELMKVENTPSEIRHRLCAILFDRIQEVFAEWLTFSEEKYNRYFAILRYIIESGNPL